MNFHMDAYNDLSRDQAQEELNKALDQMNRIDRVIKEQGKPADALQIKSRADSKDKCAALRARLKK